MGPCVGPHCDRQATRRQMCNTHYTQWKTHGALKPIRPYADVDARFDWFTERTGECWVWTGTRETKMGYGQFPVDGRSTYAHRWSYERFVGPIPDGLEIDHLCRNPPCVNPAHLEAVTHAENMRRARKTHCPRGHPYDETNTYVRPDGYRDCKICINRRSRERNARRRAA